MCHFLFNIGDITLSLDLPPSPSTYRLSVSARDGLDALSAQEADVSITVLDSSTEPPRFSSLYYSFSLDENTDINHSVGSVRASSDTGKTSGIEASITIYYCIIVLSISSRREHITPVLMKLHWLKIQDRIIYKMLMLTYKSYYNMAPPYLCELINKKKVM